MTGHINVMLVLQSRTDSLQVLSGPSSETFPTSSDVTNDVSSIEVEENVVVREEGFIATSEGANVCVKHEIPEDLNFSGLKSEPDEVSYVFVCLLLDTFHQCPEMSVVFVMPIFLANETGIHLGTKRICCVCVCARARACVRAGWLGLQAVAEKTKIYSHLHVAKNSYPQDVS